MNKTRPVPHARKETLELLAQLENGINMAEKTGDLRLMISAMAEKAEVLKQAVAESIEWAKLNTPQP